MPRWPSLEEKRNRRTDRPAESGKRCRAAGGAWPPDPSKHISTVPSTGKRRPRPPEGPRGRSANCGNGLFAQCVRLRSEINRGVSSDLTEHMAHLVQAAVWTAGWMTGSPTTA